MADDIENNIRKILKTGIKKDNKKEPENIVISHNIICGDNSNVYYNIEKPKRSSKKIYNPGTIGANVFIANNIKNLCKKIIDARCETKPKSQQKSVSTGFYKKLNQNFNVKNREELFSLTEEFATPIINYLNELYDNTKKGRIAKAAQKPKYKHSTPYYYKIEKEILDKLNKDTHDDDLVDLRYRYFNVNSRKQMKQEHWEIYITELKNKFNDLLKD